MYCTVNKTTETDLLIWFKGWVLHAYSVVLSESFPDLFILTLCIFLEITLPSCKNTVDV